MKWGERPLTRGQVSSGKLFLACCVAIVIIVTLRILGIIY